MYRNKDCTGLDWSLSRDVYAGNYVNYMKLVNLVNQGKLVKLVNFGKLLKSVKPVKFVKLQVFSSC